MASSKTKSIPSAMESQRIMRIKVNRIAICQTLKVEHVMKHLRHHGIFSKQDEQKIMGAGVHPYDRARALVERLLHYCGGGDWYHHFRESLKNPEVQDKTVRKKYLILVEFLDNTILHVPRPPLPSKSTMRLPHYEPLPCIPPVPSETPGSKGHGSRVGSRFTFNLGMTPDEEDERLLLTEESESESTRMSHIVGAFDGRGRDERLENGTVENSLPENEQKVESLLENLEVRFKPLTIPLDHFKELLSSSDPLDSQQWKREITVLDKMKQLLKVYSEAKDGRLDGGEVLFRLPAVADVIEDEENHHLYHKYFGPLIAFRQSSILQDIATTFCHHVQRSENTDDHSERNQLMFTGFSLADLLQAFGLFYQAEHVLHSLVLHLQQNPVLETWRGIRESFVKLTAIRIGNLDLHGADNSLQSVADMTSKINSMSFGQDILDEVDIYIELSTLMRERGSIGPALHWALASLKEVKADNHEGIVNGLCAAVHGFLGKDLLKKAQQCAVQAVQEARFYFGPRHPLHIKALLHLSFCLSSTGAEELSVQVAKKTLSLAKKSYGGYGIQLAEAHQAVAVAMLAIQDVSTKAEALEHAREGHRMARDYIHSDSPRHAPFEFCLAKALLANAQQLSAGETRQTLLYCARAEGQAACQRFESFWGLFSVKTLLASHLLAQIEDAMDERTEADQKYADVLNRLPLVVSPRTSLTGCIKADIARYFYNRGRDSEAASLLVSAICNTDVGDVRQQWLEEAHQLLIQVHHAKGDPQEGERYRQWFNDFLSRTKPLETIVPEQLEFRPQPYADFLVTFDVWHAGVEKALGKKVQSKELKSTV